MSPKITIEHIIEQAQVYASAWALVGGPFDQGNQLEVAKAEKSNLEDMLEEFTEQVFTSSAPQNLEEIAEGLTAWHKGKMENFRIILGVPGDVDIRLGSSDDAPILPEKHRKGFRMGLMVAQEWFEKFPLQITRNDPDAGV